MNIYESKYCSNKCFPPRKGSKLVYLQSSWRKNILKWSRRGIYYSRDTSILKFIAKCPLHKKTNKIFLTQLQKLLPQSSKSQWPVCPRAELRALSLSHYIFTQDRFHFQCLPRGKKVLWQHLYSQPIISKKKLNIFIHGLKLPRSKRAMQ